MKIIRLILSVQFYLLATLTASSSNLFAEQNTSAPVNVPFRYALGKDMFEKLCSSCHGQWGDGSKQGPPLMHPYYKPSHHDDPAFYRAAFNGVRAHHWKFGDMPPVKGITEIDIKAIIIYIRWLQRERGIYK